MVPYCSAGGELLGLLDVDSNEPAAFTKADQQGLEAVCNVLRDWNIFKERLSLRKQHPM